MTDHEDDVLPRWTNEELDLLRSAEADAPCARSLPAALAAAGVGTAIVASSVGAQAAAAATSSHASAVGAASVSAASAGAGTSAASGAGAGATVAAVKWSAGIALGKWIAVAAVGSAVVTGGIVLSKRTPAHDRVVPQLNRHAAHTPAQPARQQQAAEPVSTPTAVPADQPVVVPAAEPPRAPARPTRQSAASTTAAHEPPAQPDIRLEIAALDSARASLRNGHAREALTALDRYDASFGPGAALQLEASTLRIEALAQTGNRTKAETLARTFLEAHPNSPYAARIRALLTEDH